MKHLMWPCLPLVEFVFVLQKVNVNYVLIHSQGISNEFADYTFKIITFVISDLEKSHFMVQHIPFRVFTIHRTHNRLCVHP